MNPLRSWCTLREMLLSFISQRRKATQRKTILYREPFAFLRAWRKLLLSFISQRRKATQRKTMFYREPFALLTYFARTFVEFYLAETQSNAKKNNTLS